MRTGGEILIEQLARQGVAHIFTVPGESFLPVLDAMHGHDSVSPITCRNEAGAAMMAEATGKLLGRPGVALVTRGPGAANALPGVYIASQDRSPMVLLIGLPTRGLADLPTFQAIDVKGIFGTLAKWVTIVAHADDIASAVRRAFKIASAGRPGPVVIGLPEDILSQQTAAVSVAPAAIESLEPNAANLATLSDLLVSAQRPLVLAGGAIWNAEAAASLAEFAKRFDVPVATSFRRQDHFDNRHPCYAGHAGFNMDKVLSAALGDSDLVIVLGDALGDVTSQTFKLLTGEPRGQKIIHIAPDPADADGPFKATLDIIASPISAALALAQLQPARINPAWADWRKTSNAAYLTSLRPLSTPGAVQLEAVITTLSEVLPEDAIVTNGAGNYAAFLHRYFVYKSYPGQLAPLSGSMGYGLPAAIAAKFACPQRTVVALAGDGCFQMTAQELQTAVQFELNIVIIIANNRSLGTIRMHQEQRYPGRIVATSLVNPDFVAAANAAGARGERVTTTSGFQPALARALVGRGPAVIELCLDTDAISPSSTITSIRAKAISTDAN